MKLEIREDYYILFIHLLVDGHLGWFHFLAIMNNAARNIYLQVLMCVCFPRSYGNSTCKLLRNWYPVSRYNQKIYEGSNFFTLSTEIFIVYLFYYNHASWCEVTSNCGFYLHSPILWSCTSFHVSFCHLFIFFGKNVYLIHFPTLEVGCLSSC